MQTLFGWQLLRDRANGFAAAFFLALGLMLWAPALTVHAQDAAPTPPPFDESLVTIPLAPPAARAGAGLFQANCAPCHGETGLGDGPTAAELTTPPAIFADPTTVFENTPAELFWTTKYGNMAGMMPPWRNRMDDGQIWNAVAYAWSLHTSQADMAQAGVDYAESCAACHGDTGMGDGPDADPGLMDFTDLAYTVNQSQSSWLAGWQEAHSDLGADWSLDQQRGVLDYIRTFSLTPPWQNPYQPGEGVIFGRVTQGSAGGADVTTMDAYVDAYLEFDRVATFSTTVSADGTFEFRNLSIDPSLNYIASVANDGVGYSGDFIALSPMTSTVATEITVYETTDDPSVLVLDRLHWIIETEAGMLQIGQIYAVGNTSDRTFVGRVREGADVPLTFAIQIPPEAEGLVFDNGTLGDRFIQVGPAVFDTLPVMPGAATRQVIVRYAIPYVGTSYALQQALLAPAGEVSVLIADLPGMNVEATGVQFVSVEGMGDRDYQFWAEENVDPQTLEVRLDGLLAPGQPDPRLDAQSGAAAQGANATTARAASSREIPPPMEPWVGGLLAGVVAAGLIGVGLWARAAGTVRNNLTREGLIELRETLVAEVAHLDDLHALGDIGESEWMNRRSRLKAQLVDVMARINRGKQRV